MKDKDPIPMNAQQQNRRCLTFKEKMQILKEVDQGLKTKEQIAAERGKRNCSNCLFFF